MTNADYIRQMTDGRLAWFLEEMVRSNIGIMHVARVMTASFLKADADGDFGLKAWDTKRGPMY